MSSPLLLLGALNGSTPAMLHKASKFWKLLTRRWNHETFRLWLFPLIPLAWPGLEREWHHHLFGVALPSSRCSETQAQRTSLATDTLRCSPITSQGFSSQPPPPFLHCAVGSLLQPSSHTLLHLPYSFTPPRTHTFRQKMLLFSCSFLFFPFLRSALGPYCNCLCVPLSFVCAHRHSRMHDINLAYFANKIIPRETLTEETSKIQTLRIPDPLMKVSYPLLKQSSSSFV